MSQSPKSSNNPSAEDSRFDQRLAVARKLADQRQFADAIVLFNWLCDAYPNRAAAVIDSANAFSRVFDYAGTAMRFAQVEAYGAAPVEAWLAMADISLGLHRPAWAERFFNRAIANGSAEALGEYALHCEHANQLDQCEELSDRGLKIDPANGKCLLARARVLRRKKLLDLAQATLQQIHTQPNADPRTRISAWYESAHIHDAQEDCAAAMQALHQAKQLAVTLPEHAKFLSRAVVSEKQHHHFLTALNADFFASSWKPASSRKLALLAGHPRSGTTLLEQILDSHTGIVAAEEVAVFGSGVNEPFLRDCDGPDLCHAALRIPPDRLEQFRSLYFDLIDSVLDQPVADRLLIDKNPSCTDCIPVFARVFPEARFIIALRDPRDVVLSCYFQDLPVNDITVRFQSLSETAMRYANTMAMWLVCRENMDESRWTEVRYESLVQGLPGESKKVTDFLQLDWQNQQQNPHDHARGHLVQSPTYAQVVQPVHSKAVGRWKRYQPWLGDALPILETFVEAFEY